MRADPGVLAHLDNAGAPLGEALKLAKIVRLEVHGPAAELDKPRGPMTALNPLFDVIEGEGIRRLSPRSWARFQTIGCACPGGRA